MNWIKKTIILLGIVLVFAFAFNANQTITEKIQIEKQDTDFSTDSCHSSVFIQPRVNHTVASPQKTLHFSIVKYFENYLVVIPDLKISTQPNIFVNQDINRCKMVSLLLFPFHFFW